MIKLITDGGLPAPAKCCSCGYGGNERFYFWFKYKEKWGQVLICTTCMNEAASLQQTDFVQMDMYKALLSDNDRLQEENGKLELAADRFRVGLDQLVADFRHDLNGPVEPDEVPITESQLAAIDELTVETGAFDSEFDDAEKRGTSILDSLS